MRSAETLFAIWSEKPANAGGVRLRQTRSPDAEHSQGTQWLIAGSRQDRGAVVCLCRADRRRARQSRAVLVLLWLQCARPPQGFRAPTRPDGAGRTSCARSRVQLPGEASSRALTAIGALSRGWYARLCSPRAQRVPTAAIAQPNKHERALTPLLFLIHCSHRRLALANPFSRSTSWAGHG